MNNVEKSHAFNLVLKISLLFFLPLVTAWLYYIGLAYYSSYIEFWGLDIGLFPLSIAEGMRHGGYVLVTLGIKAIAGGLVTIISLTGFIAATYLIVDYILRLKIFQGVPKEISIGNASQKSPARDQLSTLMMQLMTGVAGIAIGYGVLLITVFTLYLSHNFSVDLGYDIALKSKERYDKNQIGKLPEKSKFLRQVELTLKDKNTMSGRIIVCSTMFCAFYRTDTVETINLNDLSVSRSTFSQNQTVK